MACGKVFIVLFALMASHSFVSAQEASDSATNDSSNQAASQSDPQPPTDHDQGRASSFFSINNGGLPNLGDISSLSGILGNSSSNPFLQFISTLGQLFPFPGLGNNANNSLGFPFLGSLGRSQALDLSDLDDQSESSPQDRFFFHSHSSVPIGCNYTTQPGYSCAGCREQLICRSNGVGRLRVCPFYAPYCYNGVCGTVVNTTCTNSTG